MLLKNAQIFDGQKLLEGNQSVLVENGQISAIDNSAAFDGYTGETHDLSGKTLMPGLVDCHVHLCMTASANPKVDTSKMSNSDIAIHALKSAQKTVKGGVTSVRDCGGIEYNEFGVRDAINRGEFLGPNIHASGKIICMTGGHGHEHGCEADGVDEIRKAVRQQIKKGSDMIKIMATGGVMTKGVNPEDAHYNLEEMQAGVGEAHRFHKRTASHAQGTEGIFNAVKAGIDSIEHGIFLNQEVIDMMLEAGTYVVPTLAALFNILKDAANASDNASGLQSYMVEKCQRMADAHNNSIQAFYKAGGKIAMGTDAGTPHNLHGLNAEELRLMVNIGMSNLDTLIASTYNGIDLMGLDNHGLIKEGYVADMLITNGDPLNDIEMVADVKNHHMVLKGGIIA